MTHFLAREVAQERGAVTAGLPSLLPEKRAAISYRLRQRAKSQHMAAEAAKQDQSLTSPDGKRPTTDYAAQAGLELYPAEIIKRLLRLNSQLYFEPSMHDSTLMGVYLLDPEAEGGKRFMCGMYRERKMPEFTVKQTTADGTFNPTIGWRYVLMKLIRARVISKERATVLFGSPNRDSQHWQLLTT